MKRRDINLLDFQKRFPDEKACLEHLFCLRWPNGFSCPRCGGSNHSFIRTRRLYQCLSCRYQASVTAGTIFHKTRTPIQKWFWLIFMMTRQKSGVSMLRMQKLLGIGSYRTAWLMGHKIRKSMEDRDAPWAVSGMVQTDTHIWGTLGKRSNPEPTPQTRPSFVVGIEKRRGQPLFLTIRLADAGQSAGGSGTGHLGAKGLKSTDLAGAGEKDLKDHGSSAGTSNERAPRMNDLGWVYAVIATMKGNLRGVHHGVSAKHLRRYLSEFCYRFNRRLWDAELFNWALTACLKTSTVTWSEVTI